MLLANHSEIMHVNVNAPRYFVVCELANRMFGVECGGEETRGLVLNIFVESGSCYLMGGCHFVYFSLPIISWSWGCRCGLV